MPVHPASYNKTLEDFIASGDFQRLCERCEAYDDQENDSEE